jgi:hypothetical protein
MTLSNLKQVPDATGMEWLVVSPKTPILWPRGEEENWLMNPPVRYIITSDMKAAIADKLASFSSLKGARYYKPLQGNANLAQTRVLVERHRDRGIGDLLFLTGPLHYLQHTNSYTTQFFFYAATERAHVLHGNPHLFAEQTLTGPVIYDTLPLYNWHWFIETATEYDEEPEPNNVYDTLYRQIGIEPEKVDAKFKRPVLKVFKSDQQRADDFFRLLYYDRQEHWGKTPYWIVAPTSASSLRSASYSMWLNLIQELSKTRHVIIVGSASNGLMPATDIDFSTFQRHCEALSASNKNVVNLIGKTPLRLIIGLLSGAEGLVSLDSGLLYVAQALRVPAVSIWGPMHPWVRIGYDDDYMKLAVYKGKACAWSPCYAYRNFPAHKCPLGEHQEVCEVLKVVTVDDVMPKIETVLAKHITKTAPVEVKAVGK